MTITAKDLLIHAAQREAIEARLTELFKQKRAAGTTGELDGLGLRIGRPYVLESWDINSGGLVNATFQWSYQGGWDDKYILFSFDEICLDNLQAIVEAC